MTGVAGAASEKCRLSDDQQMAVLNLYERGLAMTTLAVNELRANSTNHFEKALAVVMPLLGYASETVAKTAWALHDFHCSGRMPKSGALIRAATYPRGAAPFLNKPEPDFDVGKGFAGHAVSPIIDGLADRIGNDSAQALKELAGRPLHRGCLDAITAFHGLTRYALLDMLLDPDDGLLSADGQFDPDELLIVDGEELGPNKLLAGENERRFTGIVRDLGTVVAADYGGTLTQGPATVAERHTRELLPALAAAYWELFAALSRVLAEVLLNVDDAQGTARLRNGIAAQIEDWIKQGWLAPASTHPGGRWQSARLCADKRAP